MVTNGSACKLLRIAVRFFKFPHANLTNLRTKSTLELVNNSDELSTNALLSSRNTLPVVRSKEDLERFADRIVQQGSDAIEAEGERRKKLAQEQASPTLPLE
jgi:hypothetical protein